MTDACLPVYLGGLLLLGLECLLPIAPYHDDGEEAADDRCAKDEEDDGNANGPDTWEEEGVEDMVVVHKRLYGKSGGDASGPSERMEAYHEQCPDGVVDKDGSRCDKHAEAYEAIGLGVISWHYSVDCVNALGHTIVRFGRRRERVGAREVQ